MLATPGPYRCPCPLGGTLHRTCLKLADPPFRTFKRPITGHLRTSAGTFDIYGPMLGTPTWLAYPAGANRKVRKRLDIRRRKAARKAMAHAPRKALRLR